MTSHSKHALILKFKPSLLLLAILLCISTLSKAEVYKWTDGNGNTHYSDIKPNEVSSEKLNIKTTTPNIEKTSPQNSAQKLNKNKSKDLQDQAQRLQSETQKRELNAQCQNIKDNLKTLQENSRIKISENGKVRYLTPEEIDNKKKTYSQQITELCQNQ